MHILDSHLADNGLDDAEPFTTPKVTLEHSNISGLGLGYSNDKTQASISLRL